MTRDTYLRIYLADHLAGATVGVELAKRCLSSNRGTPLGDYLSGFTGELEADRKTLEGLMKRVGARKAPLKQGAAWAAERLGRLKLNGRLVGYSDLSRLEELEGLCMGVQGKLSMWRALARLTVSDNRLASVDLEGLARSAEDQLAALEHHRLQAASRAFSPRS